METDIHTFFAHYESFFNRALAGDADMAEAAGFYSPAFIAATPRGVMTGQNDDSLRQAMAQGYARYRAIGTKGMRLDTIRVDRIDPAHALAHVGWTATYTRPGDPDVAIAFEVHYLLQVLDGGPRIFGWISGDEEAVLRQHGILPQ
ncbi:nuclear transport factor 2 family protein [Ruixingdingia sedimenti]|uniref:Nuclear transport factor 2 family protein n=1 Tax=Ruixingdingia sedimenti TaxID=3073604 RepID=A0ABU1F4U4_9RHOB|nr:nuclear transport factor 2 family protein [Xinfangfangia sp. LG-4]MDR5651889.1 nuclear transport factor 2 family protein [Xinfangfangia sp. LG-4]